MEYINVELKLLNVAVECIASLVHTQDVLGSISAQRLAILIEVSHFPPQPVLISTGKIPEIRPQLLPSISFQFIIH
jgi:hypothetical protein